MSRAPSRWIETLVIAWIVFAWAIYTWLNREGIATVLARLVRSFGE